MKFRLGLIFLVLILISNGFAQVSEVTFEEVKLKGIGSISIPSIMELQSGTYKQFSDKFSKEMGFDVSGVIIFQQSGRNDVFKASNTYARVMVEETVGKAGDYRRITSKIILTKSELKTLDAETKRTMINGFQATGGGQKLLRWDGVSVDNINGRSAMKIAYLRQLEDNPPVYVELYYIENYDREYLLTISYRQEDASIWKETLKKTKNSFNITNIRQPITRKRNNR